MNHFLAFWVFVVITVLRQAHYFWHQSGQKRVHDDSGEMHREDKIGSYLLYVLYLVIWVGALYALYTNEFFIIWYIVGLLLVVVGFLTRIKGLRDLGMSYGHEVIIWPKHTLVTRGVYSWIRHPLYVALAIELLGMVIISRELWLFVIWVFVLIVLARRVRVEDKALAKLGGSVRTYQVNVPAINIFAWFTRRKR